MDENITLDSFKILIATVVSFAIGLVINVLLARNLGPDGKGVFAVAMSFSSFLLLLADSGFSISLVYYASQRSYPTRLLLGTGLLWGAGAGLVLSAAVWLARDIAVLKFLKGVTPLPLALALGVVLFGVQTNFSSAILRGEYRLRLFSILMILRPALQCLLLVAALATRTLTLASALATVAASYFVTALVGYAVIARAGGGELRPAALPIGRLFVFGIRGQIGNIVQFFNYRFDLFLVNYFLVTTQVGLYSVSVNVAEMLWFIPNSFAITLFSKTSALPVAESNILTGQVLRVSFLLTLLSAIGLLLLGRPIIMLLFGPQFTGSVKPLVVLLPGILGLAISKILSSALAGRGKPHFLTYISIVSVVVTLVLDFLLIPRIGIVGAALASSIAYLAAGISSIGWFIRESGVPLRSLVTITRNDYRLMGDALRALRPRQ